MPKKRSRRYRPKRKIFKNCQFCKTNQEPDYKNTEVLEKYLKGLKITPREINANCAKHQRKLAKEIKKARFLAYLPFVQKIKK